MVCVHSRSASERVEAGLLPHHRDLERRIGLGVGVVMEVRLEVSMGQPVWILARSIRSDEISPMRFAQCSNVKSANLSATTQSIATHPLWGLPGQAPQ
jgi:hypothetical protein